jgi:hypothetical protein
MPAFDARIRREAWEGDGRERSGSGEQDIVVASIYGSLSNQVGTGAQPESSLEGDRTIARVWIERGERNPSKG